VKVTIDRRLKSIQDVSGSAQAFSEADLERKNVQSLRDLTAATPYVEVGTQEGNFEIYIRGVGSNNNTEIGDPATAAHIDGIYIPRPRGLGSMYFDIERVEMLRGPQGTLRGRNAMAGTLNIVTAQPKLGEWGASGSFQLGNYMQRLTKAMLNIPVGDNVAFRFAGFSERRDPYYKNEHGNSSIRAPEDADTYAYRASFKWAPSDKVALLIRHDATFERGTGITGTNLTEAMQNGILPEEIPDLRSMGFYGNQPSQSLDHLGVSAELTLNLGPVNVQLVNSYRHLKYTQVVGNSGGVNYNGNPPNNLDNYSATFWDTRSDSIVNELRLYSPDDARLKWTAGVFNLYESQYVFLGNTNDNAWGWAGQEYNHPDVKDGAIAGYADATFDISQIWRVLGGIRVTKDWKHRNGIGWGYSVGCQEGATPEQCTNRQFRFGTEGFRFAGKGRTDYTAGTDQASMLADFTNGIAQYGARDDLLGLISQPGASLPQMTEQHGSVSPNPFVDFRVGLEHNLAPTSLLYATFSTGHKSGGFNDTLTYTDENTGMKRTSVPEFGSESVYATEIGSKNQFANKKVTFNAAAFWYAWMNYQANTVESFGGAAGCVDSMDPNCKRGQSSSVRRNVGNARILGIDADLTAHLPSGFTGRLAAAFLDARFLGAEVTDTRISWDPTQQPKVNLKGNFLPRAPQVALSYGIEQSIPTPVGYFDWSLSGQSKSKMYMTQFNGDGKDSTGAVNPLLSDVVPWTHRFDASIGYARPQGDIRIDAFMTNITNMTYATSIINSPGLNLRFYNPPRMMGVRFSMYL
jgi:iron complex outermembrane receptor protein